MHDMEIDNLRDEWIDPGATKVSNEWSQDPCERMVRSFVRCEKMAEMVTDSLLFLNGNQHFYAWQPKFARLLKVDMHDLDIREAGTLPES